MRQLKINNIKVSIVIPVYNSEKFLKRCLDSVKNQTYRNIEVIIINDGSIDNSLKICEEYLIDNRFKVISQSNQGVSQTRNYGLKEATGEYIMYLDSDDWLDINLLEKCINNMMNSKVDLVIFPYISEYKNKAYKKNIFYVTENKDIINITREEFLKRLYGPLNNEKKNPLILEQLNTVWGKIYRKEILKKNFVSTSITVAEDLLYNLENSDKLQKIIYIDTTFYHYWRENSNSITTKYDPNLNKKYEFLYSKMEKIIEYYSLDNSYLERLNNRKVINLFSIIFNEVKSKESFSEKRKIIETVLHSLNNRNVWKNFSFSEMSLFWKIFYFLCMRKQVTLITLGASLLLKLRRK